MSRLETIPPRAQSIAKARNTLRRQIEDVAARRRALPTGGELPQDYVSEWIGNDLMPKKVESRSCSAGHNTLILCFHVRARNALCHAPCAPA